MWIADRGLAEITSWRLAAIMARRHPGVRVRWNSSLSDAADDILQICGLIRSKSFDLYIDRVGTIEGWIDERQSDGPRVRMHWDSILQSPSSDEADPAGLDATVSCIETALGLDCSEFPEQRLQAFPVEVMSAMVSFFVGCGRHVSTHAEQVSRSVTHEHDETHIAAFPTLIADMRSTRLLHDAEEDQVWILRVDGRPALAMNLPSALAWLSDQDGCVDLHRAAEQMGEHPVDAPAAASWLTNPNPTIAHAALLEWPRFGVPSEFVPRGWLPAGIVEAEDDPRERFLILNGFIEPEEDVAEGGREWVTTLVPLDLPTRVLRSRRRPTPGPNWTLDDSSFHEGSRPYIYRRLRGDDVPLVSAYDIDLPGNCLEVLLDYRSDLRQLYRVDDNGPSDDMLRKWEDAESLTAYVAPNGSFPFILEYCLFTLEGDQHLDLWRQNRQWEDGLHNGGLLAAETQRLIDERHFDRDVDLDAIWLPDESEMFSVDPTTARVLVNLFDRGRPVPLSVLRLADGHADDLIPLDAVDEGGTHPWESASDPTSDSAAALDALRSRTEPMRRIDLMQVLYDISVEFSSGR